MMRPTLQATDAIRILWRERTRAVLASSPVILIAAGLMTALAVVGGVDADVSARIGGLGLRNVFVSFEPNAGFRELSPQSLALIRELPGVRRVVRVAHVRQVEVGGRDEGGVELLLVDPAFFEIFPVAIRSGRIPSLADAQRPGLQALVTPSTLRNELSESTVPGRRASIRLGGFMAVVSGCMEPRGGLPSGLLGLLGEVQPEVIATSGGGRLFDPQSRFESSCLVVESAGEGAVSAVVAGIRRTLGPTILERGAVRFVLPRDVLAEERRFLDQVRGYVIAGAGLLAAVGLGSMIYARMLSVTERRAEIGLRRAVGASRMSIASLVVLESIGAGLGAAVLGCVAGGILTGPAARLLDAPAVVPWSSVPLIMIVCAALSAIAGALPAIRAASLDPTEAIRG